MSSRKNVQARHRALAAAAPVPRAHARVYAARIVALIVLSAFVAACGGGDTGSGTTTTARKDAQAPKKATLRIAYVPTTPALPLHVAKAQGFFEQNNLDVTLTEAPNISDLPNALGRQFDLALGTATDLIRAGAAGLDVVQVSGNTVSTKENPFVQIIAPPNKGIEDFGDLGGKRVGSPTLSGVVHVGTLFTAKQQGADPATIKGVEAPPPTLPDQLKAGRVDAVEALQPFAGQLLKKGNVSIGDPFSAIADPLATNFYVAQGTWAKANTDAIERFVKSMEQAAQFIDQNPEQARTILREFTGLPAPVAEGVPLPIYDFSIRTQDLDEWVRVLEDLGQLDAEVDTSTLVLSGS